MDECARNTDPWKSHPRRMLRHKATIQAARIAFGFAGIYDEDEGERIVEAEIVEAKAVATGGKPGSAPPARSLDELAGESEPEPDPTQEDDGSPAGAFAGAGKAGQQSLIDGEEPDDAH